MPLERRTLAILLRAELGFLGVAVLTAVQTPRFCGADCSTAFFLKEDVYKRQAYYGLNFLSVHSFYLQNRLE